MLPVGRWLPCRKIEEEEIESVRSSSWLEQNILFKRLVGRCPSRTPAYAVAHGVFFFACKQRCVWVALFERHMVSEDTEQPPRTVSAQCTLRDCPRFPHQLFSDGNTANIVGWGRTSIFQIPNRDYLLFVRCRTHRVHNEMNASARGTCFLGANLRCPPTR